MEQPEGSLQGSNQDRNRGGGALLLEPYLGQLNVPVAVFSPQKLVGLFFGFTELGIR